MIALPTASKTPDEQPSFSSVPPRAAAHGKRPLNICIASPEFMGLSRHCSTGIAYTALAQALAAAGHQVTCLFLGAKDPSPEAWEHWVEKYRRDGLTLIALPQINVSELVAGALVLAVAIGFLSYAVTHTGRSAATGYTLHAAFERVVQSGVDKLYHRVGIFANPL